MPSVAQLCSRRFRGNMEPTDSSQSQVGLPGSDPADPLASAAAASPALVVMQPDPPAEIRHVYEYHSNGVLHKAVLALVQYMDGRCLCEFLTKNFMAEPHGKWSVTDCGSELTVWFNYQHDGEKTMPMHPSKLFRSEAEGWHGFDHKGCAIQMVHVRTIMKSDNGRFWKPSDQL